MSKLMDRTMFELRDRQSAPLVGPEMPRPAALLRSAQQLAAQQLAAQQPATPRPAASAPAEGPGPGVQPAPEAARESTPPQPPPAEGRHERRRRERAERHAAALRASGRRPAGVVAPPAGVAPAGPDEDLRQRLLAELAARAAASTAVAA